MYVELAKIFLSAILFRAINVFGTLTTLAYVLLSVLLKALKPQASIPEDIILYTAAVFMAYVGAATIYRRVKGNRNVSKSEPINPAAIFLPIFSIGYVMGFLELSRYASFILTWVLFIALGTRKKNANHLWASASVAALMHSVIFYGAKNIFYPALYGAAYIFIIYFFDAAKGAFSFACKPEDLKEGMIPAETITWNGKKYSFSGSPFPSLMGLVRYGTENRIFKRRVVASFFSPLKKENIAEIRKLAKEYKKPVIFVQKKGDFLPFIVAGAIMALIVS